MFLSHEYKKFDSYDFKTDHAHYQYKLIDSDFESEDFESVIGDLVWQECVLFTSIIIIKEYSKRNLNVSANIIRAIQNYSQLYRHSIKYIIDTNKKCSPEFHKYEKDIKKYLLLI